MTRHWLAWLLRGCLAALLALAWWGWQHSGMALLDLNMSLC